MLIVHTLRSVDMASASLLFGAPHGPTFFGGTSWIDRVAPSEAGLFQVTEFQILDVTPGITHLTVKSRMVILVPLATNFLFSRQEHNSTS
jgi:hypothetical protein